MLLFWIVPGFKLINLLINWKNQGLIILLYLMIINLCIGGIIIIVIKPYHLPNRWPIF